MAKVFISDVHFHHKRIVEFTNRGIDTTIEDHTEWLIKLWNSQVTKQDEVFHLGDFSFSSNYDEIEQVVRRLNGQKTFLKGNHCDEKIMNKLQEKQLIRFYDYKEIKIGKQSVVLFHFPIHAWHKQAYGSWHLHGHCHGSFFIPKGKILDVGLDSAYNIYGEHKLFSEQDIEDYMEKREVQIVDQHKDRTDDYKKG
jgi:calcineurin-like phosphoesterase family protein